MISQIRQQESDPVAPLLGCNLDEIEDADAILVIGSNLRKEVPLLAHRVRKAALNGGAVSFVDIAEREYLFDVAASEHDDDLLKAEALLLKLQAKKKKQHQEQQYTPSIPMRNGTTTTTTFLLQQRQVGEKSQS